jgi:parvulin-like peptidyl-prolyl isomerase
MESMPDVVARVNDAEISSGDLQRARVDLLALSEMQDTDPAIATPTDAELDTAALESLIQRELLLQEAERRGMAADEDEVDRALGTLRKRFPDLESLGAWMQERSLTDESLMRTLREDVLTRQLTAVLLDELGEAPSEDAIEKFYSEQEGDLAVGEEVRLQIIAVDSANEATEIATALRDGASFSRLARERSLGLRASQAGVTDWVMLDSLEGPLRRVVSQLEEGAAYGPIQKSESEFVIVALTGRRAIIAETLDAAREKIRQHLTEVGRRQALQDWMAQAYDSADIDRNL